MKWFKLSDLTNKYHYVNLDEISRIYIQKYGDFNVEVKFYTVDENYFTITMSSSTCEKLEETLIIP